MYTRSTTLLLLLVLVSATSCRKLYDLLDEVEPRKVKVRDFATGLTTPFGLEVDPKGNVWVTEAGTGNNDGRVSVVTGSGTVYPVIDGFTSGIDPEGNPSGLNHLVYRDGILWILHGLEGRLYKADVSHFQPGDSTTRLRAGDLESFDIGTFVKAYDFEGDNNESNIYNLTFGPDGNLYMVDAAANAIIKRESNSGVLSVFAEIPGINNPTPVGPPVIQAVPTGIVFNGEKFLVSTLTGFPFPAGKARVYAVDRYGEVSVYQDGQLSTLVDIELGADLRPLVLEFATFGERGFAPNTGGILRVNGDKPTRLVEGLNLPTDLERQGLNTYYVTSLAERKIQKIEFTR